MREVEINGNVLEGVLCPMQDQWSDNGNFFCDPDCAWFKLEEDAFRLVNGEAHRIEVDYRMAYCKDHCIGKIKE